MILVWSDPDNGRVTRVHYKPEELPRDKRVGGVAFQREPGRPEIGRGEQAVLYLRDGDLVYDVESCDLTPEERAEDTAERLEALLSLLEQKSVVSHTEVEAQRRVVADGSTQVRR